MADVPKDFQTENVYLGDGLYAEFDGWHIKLYASDGLRETNAVYLDPYVLKSFLQYIKNLKTGFPGLER